MKVSLSLTNERHLLHMVQAVDLRAPFAMGHFQTVSRYAVLIAQEMGLPSPMVETMRKAGMLHDIGKFWIPDEILTKPGRLTSEEYALVQQHPVIGANVLEGFPSLVEVVPMIRHHHERFDGKGYPNGLTGVEIPLGARILNVADTVEAMASDRPYKKGYPLEKILSILQEEVGQQFDPGVVKAFMQGLGKAGTDIINNPGAELGGNPVDPESFQLLASALMNWLQFRLTRFPNEAASQNAGGVNNVESTPLTTLNG